jgi:hypothetical protein
VSDKLRETVAFLGVVGSLVFVGWEIRQSNVQARAAAYQAIGIATSDYHANMDVRLARLAADAADPEAIQSWERDDWLILWRSAMAGLRLAETVLLQSQQGVLPEEAMEQLGYAYFGRGFLTQPGIACLWPELRNAVGSSMRDYVEQTPVEDRPTCPAPPERLPTASYRTAPGN